MRTAIIIPCDRNYLEGLNTLLFSIFFHTAASLVEVNVVIISNDLQAEDIFHFPGIAGLIHRPDVKKYADIPQKGRFPNVVYHTWDALGLGYDRLIFMGADQLVVGDISPLLQADLPPLCAMQENTGTPTERICTGMLVIRPDAFPGLWDQWMNLATQGESYDSGDQGVINKWVKMNNIEVTFLDPFFDVSKRMFTHAGWWNKHKHQFRSIHYVGQLKPWDMKQNTRSELDHLWWSYANQEPIDIPDHV